MFACFEARRRSPYRRLCDSYPGPYYSTRQHPPNTNNTMAPLILHNVPDEELYIGDDGIKRPYAMVFPQYVSNPTALDCKLNATRNDIPLTQTFFP